MRSSASSHPPRGSSVFCEPLEHRRLLAGEPWGAFPQLIGQDLAAAQHPTLTGLGQSIAIIDTGVDYKHPALGAGFGAGKKVIAGYDFVDNDPDPMDEDGHGTGVAAAAAAEPYTYGGQRYQGLAPNANLVALRVDDGSDDAVTDARIERALQWVLNHYLQYRIVAVNLSLGSGQYSQPTVTGPYADELAALAQAGLFISAASGNDGLTTPPAIAYPAADPNVYAVGAITSNDVIASFTERSADLDLLAPGHNVPLPYYNLRTQQHIYLLASGTSFASPFAAAAAALLKQVNPSFSPQQILDILQQTASSNFDGDRESDPTSGLSFPRLNVAAALDRAIALASPPPTLQGSYNALAYDPGGTLHIAFYDNVSRSLKYLTRSPAGLFSSVRIVDQDGDVGRYLSLALDHNGQPGLAYYDATRRDLRYAHLQQDTFRVHRVDAQGNVGLFASLAFSPTNAPAITYYDATGRNLRFATFHAGRWGHTTIDAPGNTGLLSSLAFNPRSRRFAVVYLDVTRGAYKYAGQLPTGKWKPQIIDRPGKGGGSLQLAFDPKGLPAFSYFDAVHKRLKYAHHTGQRWTSQFVSKAGQGKDSALFFDPASGQANLVFHDQTNDALLLARAAGTGFLRTHLASGGGAWVRTALGPAAKKTALFRFDGTGLLHLMDL